MNRLLTLSLAALLPAFTLTAAAQDWAKARLEKSPRHLEWVKVKRGGREVNCFVAYPQVKDKATAVLLVHEIFGLSDWVREMADELAEAGYIAIAPDLLSGAGPGGAGMVEPGSSEAGRRAVAALPPEQVMADLRAAADYVTGLAACNGKLVVAGFCWGGNQAFRYAANDGPRLKAAFVFYGSAPEGVQEMSRIVCPVYGFYGGNDARVTATVPGTTELMKAAGKGYKPVIYEGAGHGFMRIGEAPDASPADRKARQAAWQRWLELLKKT